MAPPTVQVLVAWANAPRDNIAAITNIRTGSVLINEWTDISAYVTDASWMRGRSHELTAFSPGSLSLTLDNKDGTFSPWNTASIFAGYLMPMRWVQVRVGGVKRFSGHIASFPEQWPTRRGRWVTLTANDPLALLAQKNITGNGYATAIATDGGANLLAYYRMGDSIATPGSQLTDSSGNARHGTFAGVVTPLQPGAPLADTSTSCDFGTTNTAGKTFGSATLPHAAVPQGSAGYSIEFWWKSSPNSATAGGAFYAYVVPIEGGAPGVNFGFYLQIYVSGALVGKLVYTEGDGGATTRGCLNSSALIVDQQWHHIVITRTSDGKTVNTYIDGVLDHNIVFGAALALPSSDGVAEPTCIGQIGTDPVMDGSMDELAFYSTPLTAGQVLSHYKLGVAAFAASLSGARISAILDVLTWPSALRTIGTGVSNLQAQTTPLTTTKALSYMQTVELTEAGALYAGPDGKIVFVDRNAIATTAWGTVAATFGDNPGELPFEEGPAPVLDTTDLYTEATVQRAGGITQYAADTAAGNTFGERTRSLTGLLSSTDAESLGRAQWEVDRYHVPLERLASITLQHTAAAGMTTALLALDLLSPVQANRHDITGDLFAQTALVEGIAEHVTPDLYTVTLSLSPVQAQRYWVLGTSALGTTTRLSF